jgi:hypothetical protein
MANRMGIEEVPWLNMTWFCLYTQLILSILASSFRPDFLTLTAVAIGFYLLDEPENC